LAGKTPAVLGLENFSLGRERVLALWWVIMGNTVKFLLWIMVRVLVIDRSHWWHFFCYAYEPGIIVAGKKIVLRIFVVRRQRQFAILDALAGNWGWGSVHWLVFCV
jgi:hypothetical protein